MESQSDHEGSMENLPHVWGQLLRSFAQGMARGKGQPREDQGSQGSCRDHGRGQDVERMESSGAGSPARKQGNLSSDSDQQ